MQKTPTFESFMVITHFCISLNPCSSRTTVSLETKNFISKQTDKYWYQGSTDRVDYKSNYPKIQILICIFG